MSTALSMLDIPIPEEDEMSEDKFDGYVDDDDDSNEDSGERLVSGVPIRVLEHPPQL